MSRLDMLRAPFEQNRDWLSERVETGIEQNRKVNACVQVKDAQGAPVPGVKVHYRLKRHAFLHGANCFMLDELETPEKNEIYKERFAKVFNQATLPFYWADLEPEMGKTRYQKDSPKVYRRPAPDLCLEYCDEKNIVPKLHCLNYDQWTPLWMDPHDIPKIKELLEKRIREIAERYVDKIHCMEVINETLLGVGECIGRQGTDFFWTDDLVSWSFDVARKYLPKNELVINEASGFAWDVDRGERSNYFLTVQDALRRGADIDAIGLQYHLFHHRDREEQEALYFLDPKRLYRAMDLYWSRFKRPLQVTEVTLPAYSNDAEDEKCQALELEALYSIWFSHPAMEAITYWNLVDGYAAFAPQGDMQSGENYYHGGLLRFDMSEKPAFHMLDELFNHRWHTQGTAETDGSGAAQFRGFCGDYEIIVEKNGQQVPFACTWHEDGCAELILG